MSRRNQIASRCGFECVPSLGRYLGVPLFTSIITKSFHSFIVDCMRRKLGVWRTNNLSLVRHVTLVNSILSTLPNYIMQIVSLPKGLCEDIDGIIRNFMWGHNSGSRKINLVDWNSICDS